MSVRRTLVAASAVFLVVVGAGVGIALWPTSTVAIGDQTVGGSATSPSPSAAPVEPSLEPITFAVVGDSISARANRAGLDQSAGSWTSYATDDELEFVDTGWAQSGAKLREMQQNLTAVDADVLVILAGTNDLTSAVSVADRLAIVGKLAQQSGAGRIVVSAVPPFDALPAASTEWNAALAEYAADNGWQFVDPWAALRTTDDRYIARYSVDGIHPTNQAAELVGIAIRKALEGPDRIAA